MLTHAAVARRQHHVHDEKNGVNGSPHYLAPERVSGGPPNVATDIYALGVLGYLLFTGTLPFDGSVVDVLTAQIHSEAVPISVRRGKPVDGAVESLIGRAMEKHPAMRHASAAAFRYELNTVMDMLDMSRRRGRSTSGSMNAVDARDATLRESFECSNLPQALLSSKARSRS